MNVNRIVAALAAASALSLPSAAAAMDVATFLGKAEQLKRKGLAAPFSEDYRLVRKELDRATRRVEEERAAAMASGRPVPYCPNGKPELKREEIFAAMKAVPAVDRAAVDVSTALRQAFARKYPCR